MHDYTLLREALASISRWKNQSVIICVDLNVLDKEKYLSPIMSDAFLLRSVGINIIITCIGEKTSVFIKKIRDRGMNTVVLNRLSDIIDIAELLKVSKVFFLNNVDGIYDQNHILVREMTSSEAENMLHSDTISGGMSKKVHLAIQLCKKKVERVHLVNGLKEGSFIDEFLSSKGSGTMIYRNGLAYKMVRPALQDDVVDITHIVRENISSSVIEEIVSRHISSYKVFTVDGHIHAVALSLISDSVIEVDYLAHSSEFDASEALQILLKNIIDEAHMLGVTKITVDPSKSPSLIGIWPWFLKLGFQKRVSEVVKSRVLWEKSVR